MGIVRKHLIFINLFLRKNFNTLDVIKMFLKLRDKISPHCTDEHVMHITLPISRETILMGADIVDVKKQENDAARYFSLYISGASKKEANRLFNSLSNEGEIKLPISEQFWG